MARTPPLLLWVLLLVAARPAEASSCDMLSRDERAMVEEMIGGPIASSTAGQPCDQPQTRCPIGLDLLEEVCRWVWEGKSRPEIEAAVRARTKAKKGKVKIALDEATRAGDANAPVVVVEYACPRCPFCKGLTMRLYEEVTKGRLRGKAKVYFRPFPLRNHPGAKEGGMAMMAAAKMGAFWPYVLHLYEKYDEFEPDRLSGWAAEVGLDRRQFDALSKAPQTRSALVASYKEGKRNGVNATPTLFINGEEYDGALDIDTVVAALSAAHSKSR